MLYEPIDPKLLTLFKDVVGYNPDPVNRAFFVDAQYDIAYGGYRRGWGLGDLLVRYLGKIEWNEVQPGIYDVENNDFIRNENLPTRRTEGGAYDVTTPDQVNDRFNYEHERLQNAFTIRMNPTEVLDFISDATHRESVSERVMNIGTFYQTNHKNHFVARLDKNEHNEWIAVLETPHGLVASLVQVDKSYINFEKAQIGDWVIFEIVGVVNEQRVVKAMRPFKPGVRMAVQYFRSGTVLSGPRYSIIPYEDGNAITDLHVKDFPFLKGQDLKCANFAPMLTVQLDTLQRVMRALSTFKMVEIKYLDSHTPFLVYGIDDKGYQVECLVSALSPFKNGKVVTV